MLKGQKLLVTGPAGNIAYPLCRELAKDNEVWGIARFSKPEDRARVEALGVKAVQVDQAAGDFSSVPDDFDYLLHLAAATGGTDFESAIRTNAEGTGLLLAHCRKAKAALVMSTTGVYKPNPDPLHPFLETDPIGDGSVPGAPAYAITKVMEEGVARAMARHLNLPVVIARMNAAYGDTGSGGYPGHHFRTIQAGEPVRVRWNPNAYSPIHDRDIFEQLPALLGAASVPATVVNWGGDQVVSVQEWCQYMGELMGKKVEFIVQEIPGSQRGVVLDATKRMAITGPSRVDWRDGIRGLVEAQLRQ